MIYHQERHIFSKFIKISCRTPIII